MKIPVLTIDVRSEGDILLIRQRAGEAAGAVGLYEGQKARLTSSMTRAAADLLRRGGGLLELLADDSTGHDLLLRAGDRVFGLHDLVRDPSVSEDDVQAVPADLATVRQIFDEEHLLAKVPPLAPARLFDGGAEWRETGPLDNTFAVAERSTLLLEWSGMEERANLLRALSAVRDREEQLQRLARAVEQSPAMIMVTDATGSIEFVNPKFCEFTGYSAEDVVGQKPSLLKSGKMPSEDYERLWCEILSGKQWRGEFHNRKKNGELFWEMAFISPIRDESGVITHFLAIKEDITDRKKVEAELVRAREEAMKASRAKSEFLANMSHEIRTPLNAIIGMADLLWETSLTAEQREYVRVFRRAGSALLNLINDVLDLSKVEAGHLTLETVDFDLHNLVEKTCEVMAVPAHEKDVELICHIKPGVPTELLGDPDRVRQVLTNLIANAVKFTERGEVVLEVEPDQTSNAASYSDGKYRLKFAVRDTGIGIPAEKLDTIFDRFAQADLDTSRRYGGTGLGLTISKRLVELMGGQIWAESQKGQGTTFYFTAEFKLQPRDRGTVSRIHSSLKGLRVMVVDDNGTNRFILTEMLATWGVQATALPSGELALAELRRAKEEGAPYRLVLLDCRMPDMDGFQVAGRISDEMGSADTTVMMLTSDRLNGDLARMQEMGIAHYLVKPVKRSDLLDGIATSLGKPHIATEEPLGESIDPQEPLDTRPLHVLLVEDSEDSQLLIQSYLRKTPYVLEFAENGDVAVQKVVRGSYDIVLMDTQMPVMDGSAATRAIRAWERDNGRKPTPIVALTAYALREDAQRSLEAGCDAHLAKPVKKAKLLATIREYAAADLGGESPRPDETADGTIVVRADSEIKELIPRYLVNRRKEIDLLRDSMVRGDYEAIRNMGHAMKGTGGGYGFEPISEIGKDLEEAASNPDAHRIGLAIDRLRDYLDRVEVRFD